MCGDCEQFPCTCRRVDDDLWITCLADHDNIPVVQGAAS